MPGSSLPSLAVDSSAEVIGASVLSVPGADVLRLSASVVEKSVEALGKKMIGAMNDIAQHE